MQRRILAAVAVAAVMATAGCGFLLGNEPLRLNASQVTVSDSAVEETGYEETNVTEQVIREEVEAAGQTREVIATNHLAQYERQVGLEPLGEQRAAVFVAFSSPQAEVLGKSFSPLATMSEREILQQAQTSYRGLEVGEQTGSRNITTLGSERTVKQFDGTATLAGQEVDVVIHAGKFEHGDDFIGVVAIYPERIDGEEDRVVTMVQGLEHDG
ncbi:hypothetical protein BV210_15505 [Halorientalis sp. IM1011]|uniref:DUF6517 family protein n=1 Tax=Halorientalis sp. IM1011 TaxID=1932360 RepID=UPI00097CC81A|nr:DUF6517 family protein [Halorientalis sp. IM1011]AQL44583.1 hypothetical protein BV210_15505 [Halorientalis sp. IM1011]